MLNKFLIYSLYSRTCVHNSPVLQFKQLKKITRKEKRSFSWCKNLEIVHVYTPDSENNVQNELTVSSSQFFFMRTA